MPASEERRQLFGWAPLLRGQMALDTDATAIYVRSAQQEEDERMERAKDVTARYIAQLELDGYL